MKNPTYKLLIAFALCFSVLLAACSKGSDSESCGNVTALEVTQRESRVTFVLTVAGEAQNYEVSVVPASSSPAPEKGQSTFFADKTAERPFTSLGMYSGFSYLVYARAICSGGQGPWSAPKSITISDYCSSPIDLKIANSSNRIVFSWDNRGAATEYEVQYGKSGFSIGSGTVIDVDANTSFEGMSMAAGERYDFYVRGKCSVTGWSAWAGPLTYQSTGNYNTCSAPTNVTYNVESNSGGAGSVSFNWNYNGETNFEYTSVPAGNAVSTGSVQSISSGFQPVVVIARGPSFDFYVRTVCAGGGRTEWVGPTRFSLP